MIICLNQTLFTLIKNLFKNVSKKSVRASIVVLIVAVALSLTEAYRIFLLQVNYSHPSYSGMYPLLFEYIAFASIPLFIDWCWQTYGTRRYLRVALICFVFTLVYLSVMSWVEWMISFESYSYWRGVVFSITHSGPKILVIAGLTLGALIILKIPRQEEIAYVDQLEIKDKNGFFMLNVNDIYCMESNDNYVTLFLKGGKSHMIRQTISRLEMILDPRHFQRIHRKFIINTSKVESWKPDPVGGYIINIESGYTLKMSKSYKRKLSTIIGKN